MQLSATAALTVIDLQRAIDHPKWAKEGPRNNPRAEANVARLLAAWRASGRPIFHVQHDSREPDSPYRPGQPGNEFKPEARPLPGEVIIVKQTANAFVGTNLEPLLKARGIDTLVVAGVITNNSVEATVRMAGNLGFAVFLVEDAAFTFARRDYAGRLWSAADVHALSLANMNGEYCEITTTDAVCAAATALPA